MELVSFVRMKLFNPVLRKLAYCFAMLAYSLVRWNPNLLNQTNLDIITLMAIATEKRQPDVSDYFKDIVRMRDGTYGQEEIVDNLEKENNHVETRKE